MTQKSAGARENTGMGHPFWAVAIFLLVAMSDAQASPDLVPGSTSTFQVEIPMELRDFDRSGHRTAATSANISVTVPVDFDPTMEWSVLVVNAGSEPGANSSLRLLDHYKQAALLANWIIVAADPLPAVGRMEDNVSLRFVLDLLALDALHAAWRNAGTAAIAFAGLGGGAKFAAMLSTMFASQHSHVIGVYQAGYDEEAFRNPAMQFQVLLDETFLHMPVYVHGGDDPRSPSGVRMLGVQHTLRTAGFKNVTVNFIEGTEPADILPLQVALNWFREMAMPIKPPD